MSSTAVPQGTNLAVLAGTLSRAPEARQLPSGDTLVALELTVRAEGRVSESVPVAWLDPPAAAFAWEAGEALVVVGRVRRRFFRAGGATQSRTEVVADAVVPARRAAAARKAVAAAVESLEGDRL
jgi:single-strand DNA-binding protein